MIVSVLWFGPPDVSNWISAKHWKLLIVVITTIYNSKITSIDSTDLNVTSVRLDFLDESLSDINTIIKSTKQGTRLEGENYTNGNLNREV